MDIDKAIREMTNPLPQGSRTVLAMCDKCGHHSLVQVMRSRARVTKFVGCDICGYLMRVVAEPEEYFTAGE